MAGWVYVIDDDDAIRTVIVDALREEGYEVECAANGAEAMAYLQQCGERQPDLILLDLFMPLQHGRDFATQYRQLALPHTPIVAITAARDAGERAAQLEADGLVTKPFAIGDLLREVERHVHATAPPG